MSFSCAFWPFPSHYLLTCPSRLFILASATLKSLFWHRFSPMPWVNSSSSVPPWCPVFELIACIPTTPLCISLPYKKDERLRIRISSKWFLYSQWLGKKNNKCWLNGRINILLNENKMMRLPLRIISKLQIHSTLQEIYKGDHLWHVLSDAWSWANDTASLSHFSHLVKGE